MADWDIVARCDLKASTKAATANAVLDTISKAVSTATKAIGEFDIEFFHLCLVFTIQVSQSGFQPDASTSNNRCLICLRIANKQELGIQLNFFTSKTDFNQISQKHGYVFNVFEL